jgi:hypothetical protein
LRTWGVVLAILICGLLVSPQRAQASANGPSGGYEAWNITSVSKAKRHVTSIRLLFWKKQGSDKQVTWKCRASTTRTKYYIDVASGSSYVTKRVSFERFRKYTGGKLMSFRWNWRRDSPGKRYRYISRIGASHPDFTGYQ